MHDKFIFNICRKCFAIFHPDQKSSEPCANGDKHEAAIFPRYDPVAPIRLIVRAIRTDRLVESRPALTFTHRFRICSNCSVLFAEPPSGADELALALCEMCCSKGTQPDAAGLRHHSFDKTSNRYWLSHPNDDDGTSKVFLHPFHFCMCCASVYYAGEPSDVLKAGEATCAFDSTKIKKQKETEVCIDMRRRSEGTQPNLHSANDVDYKVEILIEQNDPPVGGMIAAPPEQ